MSNTVTFNLLNLLEQALAAIDDEIEAVRRQPSHDILFNGNKQQYRGDTEFHYRFETHNGSIQYAEIIEAEMGDETYEVYPVGMDNGRITLSFPEDFGERIDRVELEWENDFVLLKMRDELLQVKRDKDEAGQRIKSLFAPTVEQHAGVHESNKIQDDGERNEAQREAIQKAMKNRTLYVWGPPGTGKTATLGFITANYLLRDKKVLLVSNTNRAVDVGLLSVIRAFREMNNESQAEKCVRFGEPALDDELLLERSFENILEEKEQKQKEKAAKLNERLEQYHNLEQQLHEIDPDDPEQEELERTFELVSSRIESEGGVDAFEEKIERTRHVNEKVELEKQQLVATTLAKVCTSDLFRDMDFDAVVVDEGSMASLPYLIAMAHKAADHMVVVGDPMQLPPIALTDKAESKKFLEQDIFTRVSDADTTEDLFRWHDQNRPLTCFFNKQYRLKARLASIVSSVFYEGRLETAGETGDAGEEQFNEKERIALADSSKYEPYLTKNHHRRRFSPLNEIHQFLLKRIIQQKVLKEQILMKNIGVIVPFRSTVYDYRQMLTKEGYREVEVGTIHTFQGREKRVVIFDTVMTGERKGNSLRHYTVRPFDEAKNGLTVPRLLNVALSRCEEQLYVIADMHHINRMYGDKFLGKLLQRIQESGQVITQSKSPIS